MNSLLAISIRPLTINDESFLWEILYHALYIPEGDDPLPLNIFEQPEISRYVQNWGLSDDIGFLAIGSIDQKPIGAVWLRLLNGDNRGYGYVDDSTPELSIAVLPMYRGQGVGTKLLDYLILNMHSKYRSISLSVSTNNPAVNLYKRFGFITIKNSSTSLTMIKSLCISRTPLVS